ncbi:MAG: sialidase family protein, partial [Patescibacteria group bacterium]
MEKNLLIMADSRGQNLKKFIKAFIAAVLHPSLAPLHISVAWVLIFVIIFQLLSPYQKNFVLGAVNIFTQSGWSGGVSGDGDANPTTATTTYSTATNITVGENLMLGPDPSNLVFSARVDATATATSTAASPRVVINTSTGELYLVYTSREFSASVGNVAFRTSTDGGLTWGARRDLTLSTIETSYPPSRPVLVFDSLNQFYVVYHSSEFSGASIYNVALRTSTDGGLTWGARRDVTANTSSTSADPTIILDSFGNLYVTYASDELVGGGGIWNIAFRTSTDGGLTWGERRDVTASTTVTALIPVIVRDSSGNLYVTYYSGEFASSTSINNIALRTSTDGGLTWGARRDVTASTTADSRWPTLALDTSENLYVAYYSYEYFSTVYNIALRTSTDGGLTWGARRDVTANSTLLSAALPSMAVDSLNNLYVSYYSTEYSNNTSFRNIALRTSTDGGLTWGARNDLSTSTAVTNVTSRLALNPTNNKIVVVYTSQEYDSGTTNIAARTANYGQYTPTGTLVSVPFDSGNSVNTMSELSWNEDSTLPSTSSVTLSLRTASTSAALSSSPWTDF